MEKQEKTETIIYGGAFNPPTLAHHAILQACVDYARAHHADMWIMPSGNRVDKMISVDRNRRLDYIQAMINGVEHSDTSIVVETTELDRPVAVETYDSVMELADRFPERRFSWVFGADSTETMGEWLHGDWLLENLSMLVVAREGSVTNPLAHQVVPLRVSTIVVSSTEVRRRLEVGEPIDGLVTDHVKELLIS